MNQYAGDARGYASTHPPHANAHAREHATARNNAQPEPMQQDNAQPTQTPKPLLLTKPGNEVKFGYDDCYTSLDVAMRSADIPPHDFKITMLSETGSVATPASADTPLTCFAPLCIAQVQ